MSWIVRIVVDHSSIDSITTAAVVADSTGCAEVTDPAAPGVTTLVIGFDTKPEAGRFARDHPGAEVEAVDPSLWAQSEVTILSHASGPIELEVGTAFGHGGHPTTKLALDALADLGKGEGRTFLDVGCGTGVLSIAAARQGFIVSGCDIDPDAVGIASRNADRNGVDDRVSFVCATPTQLATPAWLMRSTGFDAVVVNTLVGVHEAEGAAITALASEIAPILITGLQGKDQLNRAVASYEGRTASRHRRLHPWLLATLSAESIAPVATSVGEVSATEIPGIQLEAVTKWLTDSIDGVQAPFSFVPIAGGHSNLTFAVTDTAGRKLVLRRPPLTAVLATAHDMVREHRVITAFGPTTVACPETLGLCTDEEVNGAPFYVMDFVEGVVLHDRATTADSLPRDQRIALSESVVDTLAALHTADPDEIGLGELGRRSGYLERQLRRWQGMWEATKTRELPAMDRTHQLLVQHLPEEKYNTVVHGDYRLGNMLVTPETGQVAAVLDWELCTLGDPLADLGYLLNNWVEPGEADQIAGATDFPTADGGFFSRDEVISRYAEATGFDVQNADYYRAFQFWRLGAIVEGVLSRYMKGALDNDVDLDSFRIQVDSLSGMALELAEGM